MDFLTIEVDGETVVEYNLDLFETHIDEIISRVKSELGATSASKDKISFSDYASLSKLQELMVSYLF